MSPGAADAILTSSIVSRSAAPNPSLHWSRRGITGLAWLYLIAAISIWFLFRLAGDYWWFATVLIFAPRGLYALPLLPLLPLALWLTRWALVPLLVAAFVVVFGIMGFCIPWGRSSVPESARFRIITCNMEGGENSRFALAELAVKEQADFVALQECGDHVQIPWPSNWHVHSEGSLTIASRYPLSDIHISTRAHPRSPWPPVNGLRCAVALPTGKVYVCCAHLMSPREGLEQVLDRRLAVAPEKSYFLNRQLEYRRWESAELRQWLTGFHEPTILMGDFNMPVDSAIYRENWSAFTNAFHTAGFGFGYTKITSKRGFQYGARIDHILYDSAAFACGTCRVGPDVGSDHLPVVADLAILGRSPLAPVTRQTNMTCYERCLQDFECATFSRLRQPGTWAAVDCTDSASQFPSLYASNESNLVLFPGHK